MIVLPAFLQNPAFRFIKLGSSGDWLKIPVEIGWNIFTLEELKPYIEEKQKQWDEAEASGKHAEMKTEGKRVSQRPEYRGRLNNYDINDPEFRDWLEDGRNYGVTSAGGLIKLESDDILKWRALGVMDLIPQTAEVQSSENNRRHFYLYGPTVADSPLFDPRGGEDIGHIRGTGEAGGRGGMVVGPGCRHPKGSKYKVIQDIPIATINQEALDKIKEILKRPADYKVKTAAIEKKGRVLVKASGKNRSKLNLKDPFEDVYISRVLGADYRSFHPEGSQMAGPNPYGNHSNRTGHNFVITPDDKSYYCFACEQGGGVARLLAIKHGLIRCNSSEGPKGEDWWNTVRYAVGDGLITKDQALLAGLRVPKEEQKKIVKEPAKETETVQIEKHDKEVAISGVCEIPIEQRIRVTIGPNLAVNIDDCLMALYENNIPPIIFQRTGELCRIKPTGEGRYKVEELTDYALRTELSRAAIFEKKAGEEFEECRAPMDLVRGILSLPTWEFPELTGLINSPVIRPDGSVLATPGYDQATHLYYAPDPTLKIPEIPKEPTKEDAIEAAKFIIDEILRDFPFVDEASRINALAAFLSPVVRPMVDGCVPMALVDKPSPGTGASKILDLVSIVTTGRPMAALSPPPDDDEWRKLITGNMRDGSALICLDNIASDLKADSLARALSSSIWKDRTLGKPDAVEYPQRACWYATGNNLTLNGDIPRRSYLIQIDAKMARPWERKPTNFHHPNINLWVKGLRGDILAKLLTMAGAWARAGRPNGTDKIIGGFDEWVAVLGGILKYCGLEDFLGNLEKLYEEVDAGSDEWSEFFGYWKEVYADQLVTTSTLLEAIANRNGGFRNHIPVELAEKIKYNAPGDAKKVGILLKKKLNVRYNLGELSIMLVYEMDKKKKIKMWKVTEEKNRAVS